MPLTWQPPTLGSSSAVMIRPGASALFYDRGILADKIYMHAGHAGKIVTRERYIPIHTIARELGNGVSACPPVAHALY